MTSQELATRILRRPSRRGIAARPLILTVLVVGALLSAIVLSQWRPRPLQVSGILEADEIRLGSRVGGRVRGVLVQEGQKVRPGDRLLELEPFDLLELEQQAEQQLAARNADLRRLEEGYRPEEIAQAKARLDQLQARLDQLVAGPRPQEIDAAEARLTMAEAELKLARQTFERISRLEATRATSREELERATERLDAAQAALLVRRRELDLLRLGSREEEIRAAKAGVEEARQGWLLAKQGFRQSEVDQARAARDAAVAERNAIQKRIAELQVVSPVAGVVEALELQPGDLVSPNAPVISLVDTSRLWVRAYLPENQMAVQLGDKVRVQVDSFPNRTFTGEITYVSRQAEFTPSNAQTPDERSKQVFRVKVMLLEGLDLLRPGMAADVLIDSGQVPAPGTQQP